MTVLNFQLGLEQSSWDAGFDHNTVRDSGNVNGIRDFTATRETGFPQKTGSGSRAMLGRAMTEFRDAGFSAGSGSLSRPYFKRSYSQSRLKIPRYGIGKESDFRKSNGGSSGRGILRGIRTTFPDPISKEHTRSQA